MRLLWHEAHVYFLAHSDVLCAVELHIVEQVIRAVCGRKMLKFNSVKFSFNLHTSSHNKLWDTISCAIAEQYLTSYMNLDDINTALNYCVLLQ